MLLYDNTITQEILSAHPPQYFHGTRAAARAARRSHWENLRAVTGQLVNQSPVPFALSLSLSASIILYLDEPLLISPWSRSNGREWAEPHLPPPRSSVGALRIWSPRSQVTLSGTFSLFLSSLLGLAVFISISLLFSFLLRRNSWLSGGSTLPPKLPPSRNVVFCLLPHNLTAVCFPAVVVCLVF